MIKLIRGACPPRLKKDQASLTAIFAADSNKRPWNRDYIKKALLAQSFKKCAYCETRLGEESKYLEVEHYLPKDPHPSLVVDWQNLLPSCKGCNVKKGTYDPVVDGPLVNPFIDNPPSHLRLAITARLTGKTVAGIATIQEIGLNDASRLAVKRFEVANLLREKLEELHDLTTGGTWPTDRRLQRRVRRSTAGLLGETARETAYAATAATTLCMDHNYAAIRTALTSIGMWDASLIAADSDMRTIALV